MATKPLIKESLLLLNVSGINPNNQNKWSRTKSITMAILHVYLVIELGLYAGFNLKHLQSLISMINLSAEYQIMSKTLLMMAKKQVFNNIFKKMDQFWPLSKHSAQLQLEVKYIYGTTKRYIKLYFGLLLFISTAYVLKPIFTTDKILPYLTYHPVNLNKSPLYEVTYVLQVLITFVGAVAMVGFDGLFMVLIMYVVCELKCIKEKFSAVSIKKGNEKSCMRKIKNLIYHHNLVLGCIKDLNEGYSILLLNQFFTCMMLICAGLLTMTAEKFPPDLENFSKYAAITTTFLGQLFLYCFVGTYLTEESQKISTAVYESDWWVETQPELRRAYTLVIQRANKTEKLSAGGMLDLNLQTFQTILNVSYSFFTLLQARYVTTDEA